MDIFNRHFGLLIAYLLPGFIALIGIAPLVPLVARWLQPNQTGDFAAPIYAILAATTAGMVSSCFRWAIIDQIHARTGLSAPEFNARALEDKPDAFNYLVEGHYRYYQFYANTLIAIFFTYIVRRLLVPIPLFSLANLALVVLSVVLFFGSRDALRKYRRRNRQLLQQLSYFNVNGEEMTNGIDHHQGGGSAEKPPQPKTNAKADASPKPQPTAKQSGKPKS